MPIRQTRSSDTEIALTISTKTLVKVIITILVTLILIAALRKAAYALTLVFVAFFLAVALNSPVSWISNHLPGPLRGHRVAPIALSFLVVIALLAFIVANIVPPIVHQTQSFIHQIPSFVQNLQNNNSQLGQFIDKYHLQGQINSFLSGLSSRLEHSSGTALADLTRIGSSIFATITVVVLTFMMLIEGPHWLQLSRSMLPASHRARAERLANNMYKAVKGYVDAQVLLAAFAAFVVLPGLLIFHVSFPIAMMAVVFVSGLIPMVGHPIGTLVVTLVALFHSPLSALGIFIYYVLYQQIEAYVIQPRLQATTTNLSPLLVLLSLVIGVSFGGLVGGLVAIPVMACVRVVVVDFLDTRRSEA